MVFDGKITIRADKQKLFFASRCLVERRDDEGLDISFYIPSKRGPMMSFLLSVKKDSVFCSATMVDPNGEKTFSPNTARFTKDRKREKKEVFLVPDFYLVFVANRTEVVWVHGEEVKISVPFRSYDERGFFSYSYDNLNIRCIFDKK